MKASTRPGAIQIVVNAYYPLGHNPAGSGCGGGAGMTTATTPSTTLI